jgi:hypothetical protein
MDFRLNLFWKQQNWSMFKKLEFYTFYQTGIVGIKLCMLFDHKLANIFIKFFHFTHFSEINVFLYSKNLNSLTLMTAV